MGSFASLPSSIDFASAVCKSPSKKRLFDEDQSEGPAVKRMRKGNEIKEETPLVRKNFSKKSLKKVMKRLNQRGDTLEQFNKRLLIFDMNGVLFLRTKNHVHDGSVSVNSRCPFKHFIYDRPHFRQFIKFAVEQRGFRVALWTSATEVVAQALSKHVLAGLDEENVVFVWNQAQCEKKLGAHLPLFRKNLARVFVDPSLAKQWNCTNTILLENSSEKILAADRRNTVLVSSFNPVAYDEEVDEFGPNGKLWDLVDRCARQTEDVRIILEDFESGKTKS